MANRLQLKRGNGAPGSIFYEGEPIYDKQGKTLFVGDTNGAGAGAGTSIASSDTYLASLEMLYKSSSSGAGAIRFYEDTDTGFGYVKLQAPTLSGIGYTLTLPANDGGVNQVLQTDGDGGLSWATMAVTSFANVAVSGQSTITADSSGDTLTFASANGIQLTTTEGSNTLTIGINTTGTATFENIKVTGIGTVGTLDVESLTQNRVVYVGTGGTLTDSSNLTFTGTTLTVGTGAGITQFSSSVSTGSSTNSVPTSSAVIDYVGALDFTLDLAGGGTNGSGNGSVSTASTLTFSGTANEVDVSVTGSTVTVGLTSDVTIGNDLTVLGNLRVVGTAVTFEAQTVQVEDRLIELGLVGGGTTASSSWDLGVSFNYGDGTAKKAGVFWLQNQFIGIASAISITNDVGVTTSDPTVSVTSYAPMISQALYFAGTNTADHLVLIRDETLTGIKNKAVNLVFDGGSYN